MFFKDPGSGCFNVKRDYQCDHWKSKGYCSDMLKVDFMSENCQKSCGLCGKYKKYVTLSPIINFDLNPGISLATCFH